jgi:hypothetical protein
MKRFIEGTDRTQTTLLPESLEDYVSSVTVGSFHRSALA